MYSRSALTPSPVLHDDEEVVSKASREDKCTQEMNEKQKLREIF